MEWNHMALKSIWIIQKYWTRLLPTVRHQKLQPDTDALRKRRQLIRPGTIFLMQGTEGIMMKIWILKGEGKLIKIKL